MKYFIVLGFCISACGSGAATDSEVAKGSGAGVEKPAPAEVTSTPAESPTPAQAGPASTIAEPATDMVPMNSEDLRSEVHLAPVLEGGARVPIVIEYEESSEGGVNGPYVSYRLQDESGFLFSVDIPYELGETWTFEGSGPIRVRAANAERTSSGGSLTLSLVDGKLRLDFVDLEFEGMGGEVDGYILGVPEERCRYLAEQSGGASASGGGSRALEVDDAWSSAFCAGIDRAFP